MKNSITLTIGAFTFLVGLMLLVYAFWGDFGIVEPSNEYLFSIYEDNNDSAISLDGGLNNLNITEIDEYGIPTFSDDTVKLRFRETESSPTQVLAEIDSSYKWFLNINCHSCEIPQIENLTFFDPFLKEFTSIHEQNGAYYYSNDLGLKQLEEYKTAYILSERLNLSQYIVEQSIESSMRSYKINSIAPLSFYAYLEGISHFEITPEDPRETVEIVIKNSDGITVYNSACQAVQKKDLDLLDIEINKILSSNITVDILRNEPLSNYFYTDHNCVAQQIVPSIYFFERSGLYGSRAETHNEYLTQELSKDLYRVELSANKPVQIRDLSINTNKIALIPPIEVYNEWEFSVESPSNNPISFEPDYSFPNTPAFSRRDTNEPTFGTIYSSLPGILKGPLVYPQGIHLFSPFTFLYNSYQPEVVIADHIQETTASGNALITVPIDEKITSGGFSFILHKEIWNLSSPIEGNFTLEERDITIPHKLGIKACDGNYSDIEKAYLTDSSRTPLASLQDDMKPFSKRNYDLGVIGEHKLLIHTKDPVELEINIPQNEGTKLVLTEVETGEEKLCSQIESAGETIEISCKSDSSNLILRIIPKNSDQVILSIRSQKSFALFFLEHASFIKAKTLHTSYSAPILVKTQSLNDPYNNELMIIDDGPSEFSIRENTTVFGPYFSLEQSDQPFVITPTQFRLPFVNYCTNEQNYELNKFLWFKFQ